MTWKCSRRCFNFIRRMGRFFASQGTYIMHNVAGGETTSLKYFRFLMTTCPALPHVYTPFRKELPLHAWAAAGYAKLIQEASQYYQPSDYRMQNHHEDTPIMIAIRHNQREAALVLHQLDPTAYLIPGKYGVTTLMMCAKHGGQKVWNALFPVAPLSFIRKQDNQCRTLLQYACMNRHSHKFVRDIVRHAPESVQRQGTRHHGESTYETCARKGYHLHLKTLLETETNLSHLLQPNCRGYTPLTIAAYYGHTKAVEVMLTFADRITNTLHTKATSKSLIVSHGDKKRMSVLSLSIKWKRYDLAAMLCQWASPAALMERGPEYQASMSYMNPEMQKHLKRLGLYAS
eukprot:PhF_6_TR44289/c0_g1_i3/m.68278